MKLPSGFLAFIAGYFSRLVWDLPAVPWPTKLFCSAFMFLQAFMLAMFSDFEEAVKK